MPAICEPGNSLEPLSIFKTHSLDGKFWYAVIFCPMKGSIQHILTVMSKHAFFFFFFLSFVTMWSGNIVHILLDHILLLAISWGE